MCFFGRAGGDGEVGSHEVDVEMDVAAREPDSGLLT